jgi:hypothetical protein
LQPGARAHQPREGSLSDEAGRQGPQRDGVGRAFAAVEHSDLADHISLLGFAQDELAAVRGHDRQANAAPQHDQHALARVPSREDRLAVLIGALDRQGCDGVEVRLLEVCEEVEARQRHADGGGHGAMILCGTMQPLPARAQCAVARPRLVRAPALC